MSRKIQWMYTVILVAIIAIITGSYLGTRGNEIVTYNFDVIGDDLRLRDFTIVTVKNKYYIPKGYKIEERKPSEVEITSCYLEISHDKKVLVDAGFSLDNRNYREMDSDSLGILDKRLKKNTVLNIRFKYTINGAEKEEAKTVEIGRYIKQKF